MSEYIIQSGDSLWKITTNAFKNKGLDESQIAQKVNDLAVNNNINLNTEIHPGEVLDLSCFDEIQNVDETTAQNEVLQDSSLNTTKESEASENIFESEKQNDNSSLYTVKSGDNLWSIVKNEFEGANDSDVAQMVEELTKANNLLNASSINTNQVLDLSCLYDTDELSEEEANGDLLGTNENENNEEVVNTDESSATDDIYTTEEYLNDIHFRDDDPYNMQYSSDAVKNQTLADYERIEQSALPTSLKHRNAPTYVENSDGSLKLKANQEYYQSEAEGPLSDMTIMVNAGHGGINPNTGGFDPGTTAGDYEEWIFNQEYAEELTEKLLAEGADVVMTQGYFKTVADSIPEFVNEFGDGKNNDNLKLVSMHANSSANTSSSGICYYWSDLNRENNADDNLASELKEATLNNGLNYNYSSSQDVKILSTANQYNVDNVIVETGFMSNPNDLNMLLNDEDYKERLTSAIVEGLINDVQS